MASPKWIKIQIKENLNNELFYVPIQGTEQYILSEHVIPISILQVFRGLENPQNYFEIYEKFKTYVSFSDYIQLARTLKQYQ
jgi:hypothetical protein